MDGKFYKPTVMRPTVMKPTAMKQLLAIAAVWVLSTLIIATGFTPVGQAAELGESQTQLLIKPDATYLFEIHCAGCHAQGGNIVRRGKTLKLKALQQNGMNSAEAITQIVVQGKGNMSAYRDRLTPDEIQAVTTYVLERANQGWK